MKIKGHARIELKDVKTGEVEVREEDNLITNFAQNVVFRPLGIWNHGLNDERRTGFLYGCTIFDMFGGLLVFDKALEENPSKYYPPADAKMIAHGSYLKSNSTAETEMGSYVETESGIAADGKSARFVYNFTAEQGNGTIASVCLTNQNAGGIGYGSETSNVRNTLSGYNESVYSGVYDAITYNRRQITLKSLYFGSVNLNKNTANQVAWLNVSKQEIAFFRENLDTAINTRKVILLDVYRAEFKDMDPMIDNNDYNTAPLLRTIEVPVPDGITIPTSWKNATKVIRTYGEVVILAYKQTAGTGIEISYFSIRYDGTVTSVKTYNIPYIISASNFEYASVVATKNYFVFSYYSSSTNYYEFFINRGSGAVSEKFDRAGTSESLRITHSTVLHQEDRLIGRGSTFRDGIFSPNNCVIRSAEEGGCAIDSEDFILGKSLSESKLCRNNLWLSTINNLDNPVVKDGTKTMKIYYTLTLED